MTPRGLIIIAALALVASAVLWIVLIFLADALPAGGLLPVPLLVLLVGGVFGLAVVIVIRYLFTHDV